MAAAGHLAAAVASAQNVEAFDVAMYDADQHMVQVGEGARSLARCPDALICWGGGSSPSASYQLPPDIHSMTMKGSDAFKLPLNIFTQCGWFTCTSCQKMAQQAGHMKRIARLEHGRHFLGELLQVTCVESDFGLGAFDSGFGPVQERAQHNACNKMRNIMPHVGMLDERV